jgi:hypothetical protein
MNSHWVFKDRDALGSVYHHLRIAFLCVSWAPSTAIDFTAPVEALKKDQISSLALIKHPPE